MSATTSAESSSSSAAGRPLSSRPRRPSRLSVRYDAPAEGARSIPLPSDVAAEHLDVHAGDKRERTDEVAVGDRPAATASSDRHVADEPHEGAVISLQSCLSLIPSCARTVGVPGVSRYLMQMHGFHDGIRV